MVEASPIVLGIAGVTAVVLLLLAGVHVALAMGLVGFLGMIVTTGHFSAGLSVLKTLPYAIGSLIDLGVLPLFILMGYLTLHSGISQSALQAAQKWLGGLPSGLSLAVTWACVGFGAVSGSSIAATSVFTKLAFPEMKRVGYETKFALGSIATAAIIAMLIPPSMLMVIYGMLAEESIAKLLIAGIFPGLLLATTLSFGMILMGIINPKLVPAATERTTWREKLASIPQLWPIVVIIVAVLGGIFTGIFTPNEAASIGTAVAFVFALARKSLTWSTLTNSLLDTLKITSAILIIFVGASIFTRFMAISGVINMASTTIIAMGVSPIVFMILATILYLILGCMIDQTSIMALTVPIFVPIVKAFSIDPIYFGVVVVAAMCIGSITPPFGLTAFATKASVGTEATIEEVFRGILPHLAGAVACMVILVAFPPIITTLPNAMMAK